MQPLGRRFDAYQSFLLGCKTYWSGTLYPQIKEECDSVGKERSLEQIDAASRESVTYRYYAYLERHLQRMKYSGRYGIVPTHEPYRDALEKRLNQPLPDGLLTLDLEFVPPDYFTVIDIHQHPGGTCGDSLAGIVYERGSRSMWPGGSKDRGLHPRFNAVVKSMCTPSRILDLGCGFGKSSQPFTEDFPNAAVTGIDVSAPCLRLAAVTAHEERTQRIRYVQACAEDTGFASGSFDLVTSTMLLHEMTPKAIQAMIDESFRLLEPGGFAVHLDYLADSDPFNRFIHYGHSRRNNEPYMRPLNEMDLSGAFRDAGFEAVSIEPFAEAPKALSKENRAWRFPWVVVSARKPKG